MLGDTGPHVQYAHFLHRQLTLGDSLYFTGKWGLETLSGLSVVATPKVLRTQTSLMVWKPELLTLLLTPLLALPLTRQHLFISGRVETSQKDFILLDLSKTSAQNLEPSLSRILLPCTCLQLPLEHWEDCWGWQINFREKMNCKYWISDNEDPLLYLTPAMYAVFTAR